MNQEVSETTVIGDEPQEQSVVSDEPAMTEGLDVKITDKE